jgi:meiotically up-regulated gene 157 (Mug157) protein
LRSLAGGKPLDLGTGVVCVSFAADGSWLSIGTVHRQHGFVELSGLPVFDETARGTPARVREYRQLMTEARHCFLALVSGPLEEPIGVDAGGSGGSGLRHVRHYDGWTLQAATTARPGEQRIVQSLTLRRGLSQGRPSELRLRFRGRLDRPALAEITEVSPPAPTGARTELTAAGSVLRVAAPSLPAEATIAVTCAKPLPGWHIREGEAELILEWPPADHELAVQVTVELLQEPAQRPSAQSNRPQRTADAPEVRAVAPPQLLVPAELRRDLHRLRHQTLDYVRGCTALRVSDDRVAILTDHRILPLSWTRDAYYQALLLLSEAHRDANLVTLVADHLRWLWLTCDRPAVAWARSHHANGRRKDEVFQADQQLYPLLELADYWRVTGELPELGEEGAASGGWPALVSRVVELLARLLSPDGLLPTDENAADDSVAHSYLLANQVLAWYSLGRLEEMGEVLPLTVPAGPLATRIGEAVRARFPVDGRSGRLWAYAIDGEGGAAVYHDANDVPTALAPLWGFCAADDPLWLATMSFAFSAANEGYVSGRFGGLGSRHTPGTWSLGLIQEWVAWSSAGDRAAAASALERLLAVAFPDGSLPETSDPDTGRALARHWFVWPGALLGALLPSGQ